jgi:hypothetical protein
MVVQFTSSYAICACHFYCCELDACPCHFYSCELDACPCHFYSCELDAYFGRSFIFVYLVPLLEVPKLNTPSAKIKNTNIL